MPAPMQPYNGPAAGDMDHGAPRPPRPPDNAPAQVVADGAPPPAAHEQRHRAGRGWRLHSRAELERMDESRLDGITPEMQRELKWAAIRVMIHAQTKLNMDVTALYTACVFLHRYFAQHSMAPHRNNVLVMTMACLYLGGKVQDSPKSVRDIIYACLERRYQGRPEVLQASRDRAWYERARERVFLAERALLYALDFDMNVETAVAYIMQILMGKTPDQQPLPQSLQPAGRACQHFMGQLGDCRRLLGHQALVIVNEGYKNTLCLQYSALQLAVACVWLSARVLQLHTPPGLDGWWACDGLLSTEELEDIVSQLLEDYSADSAEALSGLSESDWTLTEASLRDEQQLMEVEQQQQAAAAAGGAAAAEEAGGQEAEQQGNGVAAGGAAAAAAEIDEYDELWES